MSGRLDQSLDSIIDGQKKAKREARRRVRKPGKATGNVVAAPVGGVKKSTRPVKTAIKGALPGPSAPPRESTIVVSGLPYDVNETQIKEYFQKTVGAVKKVSLRYNQSGQSRGIADIRFSKPGTAAKAAKDLNGMLVDQRPMKIEVVVDASSVPAPAPVKSLGERVAANPKAQPRSATSTKATAKTGAKGRVAGKPGRPQKSAKSNRPKSKPKTAEELDAEMTDYFGGNNGATTITMTDVNGTTATEPAANGEDMDEIS